MRVLQNLEPQDVFRYFEQICAVPHPSGDLRAIGDYCAAFAVSHALRYVRDDFGNVVIFKDGDPDKEPVILQGHLDMVCVAESGTQIDFHRDPLPIATDGEYVFSRGTSLGADDGIAVAMILAILASDTRGLPPIEAVFTADEETGMDGAQGLDVSVLRGRRMLNLDSEAEGTFWVSCAGGERVILTSEMQTAQSDGDLFKVELTGLLGGHSGTEIDKGRINAVLCTAQLLRAVRDVRLCSLRGGTVDNAIPSSCTAVFCGSADDVARAFRTNEEQWRLAEPDIRLALTPVTDAPREALTAACSRRVLELFGALPNGVQQYSRALEGFVETSLNLGVCSVDTKRAEIHFSVRSSVDASKQELTEKVRRIASEYGFASQVKQAYPAWQYRADSPLRETAARAYRKRFGASPKIEAIHAGLECGLFCGKLPDLDCISIGPDIFDIHSPQERLSVASTAHTYALVRDILKEL